MRLCVAVCIGARGVGVSGGSAKARLCVTSAVLRRFCEFLKSGFREAVPQRPLAGRAPVAGLAARGPFGARDPPRGKQPWRFPLGWRCWRAGRTLLSPKQHRHGEEEARGQP